LIITTAVRPSTHEHDLVAESATPQGFDHTESEDHEVQNEP
jgi:hypothetical protein